MALIQASIKEERLELLVQDFTGGAWGGGLWQCVPALLPREGTWAGSHHRAVLQGQPRVVVPTASWAGASAELRVSVQSSSFTRQRLREHGPEGPAPGQGCGTTGVLESYHCLSYISHPEYLAVRWKGRRSPFPTGER